MLPPRTLSTAGLGLPSAEARFAVVAAPIGLGDKCATAAGMRTLILDLSGIRVLGRRGARVGRVAGAGRGTHCDCALLWTYVQVFVDMILMLTYRMGSLIRVRLGNGGVI